MDRPLSLIGRGATHLAAGRHSATGSHVEAVHQSLGLHQLLITLVAGHSLGEHDSPGEATLVVLFGHVVLSSDAESMTGHSGDLLRVPSVRHDLRAVEDAIVLLTHAVGTRGTIAPTSEEDARA
jgi:quercetin dioxygenase-like cupin family protein